MALNAARLAADFKARWLAKPDAGITTDNALGANAVNAMCEALAEAVIAELANAAVSGSCAGTVSGNPITGGTITGGIT